MKVITDLSKTDALIELARYKQDAEKIPYLCYRRELSCVQFRQSGDCEYAGPFLLEFLEKQWAIWRRRNKKYDEISSSFDRESFRAPDHEYIEEAEVLLSQ